LVSPKRVAAGAAVMKDDWSSTARCRRARQSQADERARQRRRGRHRALELARTISITTSSPAAPLEGGPRAQALT
jgi:hypothetical protein